MILASTFVLPAQSAGVDPAFNPQVTKTGGLNYTGTIALQPDGKAIVVGYAGGNTEIAIVKRLNADGSEDTSFNCPACTFSVTHAVVQPDGKIVLGGNTFSVGTILSKIIRLNPDGSLDSSFSNPAINASVERLYLQADGKILVRYFVNTINFRQQSIRRLNADGSYDQSFSTILFGSGRTVYELIGDVLPLADGKVLVGGGVSSIGSIGWVRRFNSDGTRDSAFESPVFNSTPQASFVNGLAQQTDGNYLVAGNFSTVNGVARMSVVRLFPAGNVDASFDAGITTPEDGNKIKVLADGRIMLELRHRFTAVGRLVRLNASGSPDATYTHPANFSVNYWVVDAANRIVAIGSLSGTTSIVRINQDGTLDSSFNPVFTIAGIVYAIIVQADGKIIVGGDFERAGGAVRKGIARFLPDGTLDASFDPGNGFRYPPRVLAIQADGKILAAGETGVHNDGGGAKLVRLNANGAFDTSFNATINDGSYPSAIAPLANGKILIGGDFSQVNGATRISLARLNSDGSLDTSFNALVSGGAVNDILVQADGKILIGGTFVGVGGFNRAGSARLNADGSLDASYNSSGGSIVKIIQQPDGKYILVSSFSISRRNADGSVDSSFSSFEFSDGSPNDAVLLSDGSIIVGGSFLGSRPYLVHLSSNGALDASFLPNGVNNTVYALVAQSDGKALVGGAFAYIDGVSRTGLARVIFGAARRPLFDYDGDGRADVSVFRSSENKWYVRQSSTALTTQNVFAVAGDVAAPADYDGDGKTDVAIFRPSTGDWWYLSSVNGAQVNFRWGQAGDVPRPSDFDGDGRADFIVYRPSNSVWYRYGSTGTTSILAFGIAEDKPLIGDFDGDGKSDFAVFRPSTGDWWYAASSNNNQFRAAHWGAEGDVAAPADYDGDGKTDFAVFRPSNGGWYISNSSTGSPTILGFGLQEDKPVPADYDGDGKADIAVFRPSTGTWYLMQSSLGFGALQFGVATDLPTEAAFLP